MILVQCLNRWLVFSPCKDRLRKWNERNIVASAEYLERGGPFKDLTSAVLYLLRLFSLQTLFPKGDRWKINIEIPVGRLCDSEPGSAKMIWKETECFLAGTTIVEAVLVFTDFRCPLKIHVMHVHVNDLERAFVHRC